MEKKELPIQRELRELMKQYTYLLEMGISFARDKNLNHLLDVALSRARTTTSSNAGAIFLVETTREPGGIKKTIRFKVAQNDTMPNLSHSTAEFTLPFDKKSIAGYVAATGKTLNIDDVYLIDKKMPYKFDSSFDKKIGYRTRSLLAVPIINNKGDSIGVLELINRLDRRNMLNSGQTPKAEASPPAMPYFTHDVDMAVWSAGLLGVALENIYMINELKNQNVKLDQMVQARTRELNKSLKELELKNTQMENELTLAHQMQLGIVPQKDKIKSLSQVSLLGVSSIFKPCNKLGGDFWDIIELNEDKTGIIVVDFAGHGIVPSLNTFRIKEYIHGLGNGMKSPAKLMELMNKNIFKNYSMHATCVYAIYCMREKKLIYSRAGHPYGIWYRGNEGKLTELDSKGMALGFLPDSKYEEKEITLQEGDKVIFYTDGIIEARNNKDELYGDERLKNNILQHKNKSSSAISNHIMESLAEFTGEVELDDDVTLVAMELI